MMQVVLDTLVVYRKQEDMDNDDVQHSQATVVDVDSNMDDIHIFDRMDHSKVGNVPPYILDGHAMDEEVYEADILVRTLTR
jgi:hypothetical protein